MQLAKKEKNLINQTSKFAKDGDIFVSFCTERNMLMAQSFNRQALKTYYYKLKEYCTKYDEKITKKSNNMYVWYYK